MQGYTILHMAKEAINATMCGIAIGNNIIVQTAPSLRKGYAILHIAKEAINATMCSIAIGNNIIVQTENKEGETVCKSCGLCIVRIDCPAIKVWEFPRNSEQVTTIHTCVSLYQGKSLPNWKQYSQSMGIPSKIIVSRLPLYTLVCRCTKERLFQIGNNIHKISLLMPRTG